jgi:glutamyl-tRNA reductase
VGINHQTAPITIREKASINVDKLEDSLSRLHSHVPQAIILSTCNRTEIYTTSKEDDNTSRISRDYLKTLASVDGDELLPYLYLYQDKDAVEHLFRVASGLESMAIGEFEVLGQVKQALDIAKKAGTVNLPLRQLFQHAIQTGRRVRQETAISKNALSISSVAVEFAAGTMGDLTRCNILIIGTGEAGRLVARVASERQVSRIAIASRKMSKALNLAQELNAVAVGPDDLAAEMNSANVVVTCTRAPHWILHCRQVEEIMKNRHGLPLVIIDIAVPRNVEPEVGQIRNVFLYNIDDLTAISDLNRSQRENEVHHAEKIIQTEIDKFISWWQLLEVRPTVSALMQKAEEIRCSQMNRTLKKIPSLSEEQHQRIDAMTRSIIAKILKDPVHYLKANANSEDIGLVKELFNLNEDINP